MTGLALLVVAAALLAGGAELFVDNAAGAGRRVGVSALAVGVLLAGAEPEEMLTAALAAGSGRPGLAAGDALGANITMLLLPLGLAALVRPLPFDGRARGYAVGSALAGLAALLAVSDGHVSRAEGSGLLVAYVALVALVWWREKSPPAIGELAEIDSEPEAGRPSLALALAGIALMAVGGAVAVAGASRMVAALGVADSAVGLTFLALATSAELFALVLAALRRHVSEVAVGGVVGSAAFNATASLGLAALVRPLAVPGLMVPAAVAAVLPLVVVGLAVGGPPEPAAGAGLVAGYGAYVVVVLR